ncbi:hypothetical protein [Leekyejoonella antrihumi]|uniref:Uncharacterized protein n=1 Tax=Leekyejoonella antrihumi TaxID=1660198 RepID=A0A563E4J8_9MICO|nr:hypothetical protein [Leekyejoonella antrihumi]TWP37131.1 hypothetical protein FGL98_06845 [Leekyejoonella antrihumi]
MTLPPSARELTSKEWQLVERARSTIDANTDAGPDEDCVRSVLVTDLMPLAAQWTVDGGTQTYDLVMFTDQ